MAKVNRHKDRERTPQYSLQQSPSSQDQQSSGSDDNTLSAQKNGVAASLASQPSLGVVAIIMGVLLAFALWKGLTVLDDITFVNPKSIESANTVIVSSSTEARAIESQYQSVENSNYQIASISSQIPVQPLAVNLPLRDWNTSGLLIDDLSMNLNDITDVRIPEADKTFQWKSPHNFRARANANVVYPAQEKSKPHFELSNSKSLEAETSKNTVVGNTDKSTSKSEVVTETSAMKVTDLIQEFERTKSIHTIKKLFDHWKKDPSNSELLSLWSGFLNKQGDIFVVESLYSQAHKVSPRDIVLHRQWARFYYDREEFSIASTILARVYNQAVAYEDIETLHLYAASEAKLGSVFLAEEIYRHLARIQPEEWRWVLALAYVFDEAQDIAHSEVLFQQLLGYNNLPPEVESLVQKKLIVRQEY